MNNPMSLCLICHQKSNRYACHKCQQRMRRQLAEILENYALTAAELIPGSSSGRRGTERSIGVRIEALDLLGGFDIIPVLGMWERDWRETFHLAEHERAGRVPATLSGIVKFLTTLLPRACIEHPAIDDFARELRDCHTQTRIAARVTSYRIMMVACPTIDEDGVKCAGEIPLRTYAATENDESTSALITCRVCRVTRSLETVVTIAMFDSEGEIWIDPEAAALHFGISRSKLHKWAAEGKIMRSHGRFELHSIEVALTEEASA